MRILFSGEVKYRDDKLGYENQGGFGPSSEAEASMIRDIAKPEYVAAATAETHCMDDRFTGAACQLPGGLLINELVSDYMDPNADIVPLDEMVQRKTAMIIERGRPVIVHGDSNHQRGGCAANKLRADALTFNADHPKLILDLALPRIQVLELDLDEEDIKQAIRVGGENTKKQDLWRKMSPEQVVELAIKSGAEYEEFEGGHNVACSRTDFSDNVFNSGAFRADHKADNGEPMGAFSITLGAYKNQLLKDGFIEREVAKKLMHTVLFSLGLLNLVTKEGFRDLVVV